MRKNDPEAFDPTTPAWVPAFPDPKKNAWTAEDYPPFRIYGQSGPDGLKYDGATLASGRTFFSTIPKSTATPVRFMIPKICHE